MVGSITMTHCLIAMKQYQCQPACLYMYGAKSFVWATTYIIAYYYYYCFCYHY